MTLTLVPQIPSRRRTSHGAPRRLVEAPVGPPQPFTLEHFRDWARQLILDTDEPWILEPFQEAFVSDVFAGYPECWLVVPEGNGKTTTLAGLALYHVEFRPFAAVFVAAASREQAEIMYLQAEGFVLRSPALQDQMTSVLQVAKGKRKTMVPRFTCLAGYRRINHHAGGRIQIFAADDRTGDGVIPTLGIIDELHRQRDLSLYRTWSGKLAKRNGQIITISTSGEPSSDFEKTRKSIHERAESSERKGSFVRAATPRVVLHEWAVPDTADPEDLVAVKEANPFSGITVEMLTEKLNSPTMTMHHWLRFVCNRPTQDINMWLGPEGPQLWEALKDPFTLVDGAPTWIGVDIGIKRDCTAVVTMQQRPDKRYHAVCRIWYPTPERPNDTTDVMHYLRELDGTFAVQAIGYDPRFFDVPAKMLFDEGLAMVEMPQSVERMSTAAGSLYEAIRGKGISHDGDDAFTAQILNAVPRYNERGFMLAKDETKSHGKIDAAIALVLAYDQALRHVNEATVYTAERGMVEIG